VAGRLIAAAVLPAPPALDGGGVFTVAVNVDLEVSDEEGQGRAAGCSGTERLLLQCHPEDTGDDLRLRLHDLWRLPGDDGGGGGGAKAMTASYHRWEIPVGFELGAAKTRSSGGMPWFPARHKTLGEALKAAKLDVSGRVVVAEADFAPTEASGVCGVCVCGGKICGEEGGGEDLPRHRCARAPVLRPYGTAAGIPLRRFALAGMLGVLHDCGIEGCAIGVRHDGYGPGHLGMRRLAKHVRCPLTGIDSLVAVFLHSEHQKCSSKTASESF
jgi:hypothetical protein